MGLLPKASPESPPMFESGFIDQFSRTHWSIVPILFVPAASVLFYLSLARTDVGLAPALGLAVGGFFAWTLTEYWLHRTVFHWIPGGKLGDRFHFILHGVHHSWPRDRFRLVMPPAVSITLFLFFLALFLGTMGDFGYAFTAGYAIGYMNYDVTHYRLHHVSPKTPWMKALRKHHLAHHSPKYAHECKFGVSMTLWDHVFRTYEERADPDYKASDAATEA